MTPEKELRLERIDNVESFRALRDEWNALAERSSTRSLFLRHEWCDAAWEWLRDDSALEILCLRRGTELVGICPFVSRRRRRRGLTIKTVEFLSVPDNQLCDILTAPSDLNRVLEVALAAVRAESDMLLLENVPADSPACRFLDSYLARRAVHGKQLPGQGNPCIDLTSGWKTFYSGRSRRLKKANNWTANRLERTGKKISLNWYRPGLSSHAEVVRAIEESIRLSARSWKSDTGLTLDRAGPNAFYRRLVDHALNQGWLSLWLLTLDDKPVAAEVQMIFEGSVHALRSDFDVDYNDLSVGSYLNWKLLEQLFDARLTRYWMGPGDNRYKAHWTEDVGELHGYAFYSGTWKSYWLMLCDLWLSPALRWLTGKWFRRASPATT